MPAQNCNEIYRDDLLSKPFHHVKELPNSKKNVYSELVTQIMIVKFSQKHEMERFKLERSVIVTLHEFQPSLIFSNRSCFHEMSKSHATTQD
jgi:hypothetical protein